MTLSIARSCARHPGWPCAPALLLLLQRRCYTERGRVKQHRPLTAAAAQKSSSVVKTKESKSGLALAALAMTPARWYSPTRHSKKLAFPSRLIISIQSKGLRSLYSLLYLGGAQAEGKAKLTGELCVQGKSAPHPLFAPQGHALAPVPQHPTPTPTPAPQGHALTPPPNAPHPHPHPQPNATHSPQGDQQSVRTELDVGVH